MKPTLLKTIGIAVGATAVVTPVQLYAQFNGVDPSHDSAMILYYPGFGGTNMESFLIKPSMTSASWNVTGVPDGARSSALGGICYFYYPFTAGNEFPYDTGVSQTAPGDDVNPATLTISFDIGFTTGSLITVPGLITFPTIAGNVGPAGSYVAFDDYAVLSDSDGAIKPDLSVSVNYFDNTPGAFLTSLFDADYSSVTLPANDVLYLAGYIEFTAYDPDANSSIYLPKETGFTGPDASSTACLLGFASAMLYALKRIRVANPIQTDTD